MKYPFEADFEEILATPDPFIAAIFSSLASEFLTMPKGDGFVDYPAFEAGYEALKMATGGFASMTPENVLPVVLEKPICLIVLRAMLGFTPPEWAYVAAQKAGPELNQGFARTLDRNARLSPLRPLNPRPEQLRRITAMVDAACELLNRGCPEVPDNQVHRLNKADTVGGLPALQSLATLGAPYAMLPTSASSVVPSRDTGTRSANSSVTASKMRLKTNWSAQASASGKPNARNVFPALIRLRISSSRASFTRKS